jgi:ATP-dependent DNA helicase RecQ
MMQYSSEEAHRLLSNHFGYQQFRTGQEEIIRSISEGNDTLVVMPTGGGKSLCYQIPALLRKGTALVISPLIALMQDQVEQLHKARIAASFINSSMSQSAIKQTIQQAQQGVYSLLYLAPERLESRSFVEQLSHIPVSMVAVDEAHCVSEWGHDFRPSYMSIPSVFDYIARVPVIALTATATPEVQFDILKNVGLKSPKTFIRGFDRPNLSYRTEECKNKSERILDIVTETEAGSTIVYCGSRKRVEMFTAQLREYNTFALGYHGGMEDRHRQYAQQEFLSGSCRVLVATNAFGMGIDKSDVRNVIHCDLTQTLESYYQEAGRAGRDGKASNCVMLYHPTDRKLMDFFLEATYPVQEDIRLLYETLYDVQGIGLGNRSVTPLLMDSYQLAQKSGVRFIAVDAAITLFERYGIVRRGGESGLATIQFTTTQDRVREYASNIALDKQQVLIALLRSVGAGALSAPMMFDVNEMLGKHDITMQQFENAMRTFEYARIVRYQPPGASGGLTLLMERMPFSRLPIDFTAFYERRERAIRKLDIVERYAMTTECKRNFILQYFQEDDCRGSCGLCSSCLSISPKKVPRLDKDGEFLRQAILSVCSETSSRFGIGIITDILLGKESPKIQRFGMYRMKSYGIASDFDEDEISIALGQAQSDRIIEISADQFPTVSITALGFAIAKNLHPSFDIMQTVLNIDAKLLEKLTHLRAELAHIDKVSPMTIVSDIALQRIAAGLPLQREELKAVTEISDIFLSRYSSHFFAAIKQYIGADTENNDLKDSQLSPTIKESVRLARQGKSFWQIVEARNIDPGTIAKHLETAIASTIVIEREGLLGDELYRQVRQYLIHNRRAVLREVREHCGARYEMAELRVALAFARKELNIAVLPKK